MNDVVFIILKISRLQQYFFEEKKTNFITLKATNMKFLIYLYLFIDVIS